MLQLFSLFLRKEDISRCVYQGSRSFEGRLLVNVDRLERSVMELNMETIIEALPFVHTIRLFEKVITACFGQTLNHIDAFSKKYRSLDISVTPKVKVYNINMKH